MEIISGKYSGFCGGVMRAVRLANNELKNGKEKVFCLGKIVHNEKVVCTLENKGMITVDSIDKLSNNSKVIFRAHGELKNVYDEALKKGLKIIDLICPKVKKIKEKILLEKENSIIVIIGKKNHPETMANLSYCFENGAIAENSEDILNIYENFKNSQRRRVYVLSQTTFSSSKFDSLTVEIKKKFKDFEIIIDKTICDVTRNRQRETLEISKNANKMIIIGGKDSSNTKELFNIAKENCKDTYLIQDLGELENVHFDRNDKVGIMLGASTPNEDFYEVKEYIESSIK
ncbi:MAG: 4-hydroxy-3-methylbut-2-enyl diphosphate reductase [Clostridia bacterium]|nr:4-hydroxy-3-methylbut-2-enyl diphosphate reductase [Clostridia bacterium]